MSVDSIGMQLKVAEVDQPQHSCCADPAAASTVSEIATPQGIPAAAKPEAMTGDLAQALSDMEDYVSAVTHRASKQRSPDGKENASPGFSLDVNQGGINWGQIRNSVHFITAMSRAVDTVRPESEGTNAVLFSTVPAWIKYAKIAGCRYRQVIGIHDSGDETESMGLGIAFMGYPGGSGWAEKIGPVAVRRAPSPAPAC